MQATDALFDAGYLLATERDCLNKEAQLKPPNTLTLNYRDAVLSASRSHGAVV